MRENEDIIWKCPNCETINRNTDKCRVCGYERKDQGKDPLEAPPGIGGDTEEKNRNKTIIAIVISVIVLVAVLMTGLAYFLFSGHYDNSEPENNSSKQEETGAANNNSITDSSGDVISEDTNIPPPENQDIYYVINTKESGLFIREGAGKEYDIIQRIEFGDTSVTMKDLGEDQKDSYGFTWHKVELSDTGKVGYVRNDIIKKLES